MAGKGNVDGGYYHVEIRFGAGHQPAKIVVGEGAPGMFQVLVRALRFRPSWQRSSRLAWRGRPA